MTRLRHRLAAPVTALALAVGLVAVLPARPSSAAGTLAWPHFLNVHVQNRRADTRVVVDAGYAGTRWVSQPGVLAGDYLLRVDQSGFVRSLDDKLAFWRQNPAQGQGLVVQIQSPGVDGYDSFQFDPNSQPLGYQGANYASAGNANAVSDVSPYIPTFTLPMDFEFHVGSQCKPNQYLQVSPEWTRKVWRTPDGIAPGTYHVRLNADFTVTSDGSAPWTQLDAMSWDWDHPVLGASIVHSCDPAGPDGADIVGFGRNGDGTLQHMTTWSQQPDGGYGWQPFNATTASSPRPEGFYGGNYIVQQRPAPPTPPVNLTPRRLSAGSLPAVSVAASQAGFAAGSSSFAVLARFDQFADALAGIPLALARGGPLLLCSPTGVEAEVVNELRRVVTRGGTVYLLGGTQALTPAVESTIRYWGFNPVRISGTSRVETAAAIAQTIGPAANALVVNAWNFPDALAAGAAAGALQGGAHVLLTNADSVPLATRQQLALGGYSSRIVFGGPAVVNDATYADLGAGDRIWGADRDATAAVAARRFFPGARTVWVASGTDFVGGIAGGAMAARGGGPLLLTTNSLGDAARGYLKDTGPGAAYVMGGLDDSLVRAMFTQSAQ